jgi:hypothetical protein
MMLFAYADPPYIGQAHRLYRDHPDYAGEVDHCALIARLLTEYPDGWALSCSSPSLYTIQRILEDEHGLASLDGDYRISSWVKPFAVFKPNVPVAYTWEPVIFMGGRRRGRDEATVKDHFIEPITLKRGLVGAKPERVCMWIFDLMGARSDDALDDLYPGTGAVTAAWAKFQAQHRPEQIELAFDIP